MHGLILRQAYDYWQDQPGNYYSLDLHLTAHVKPPKEVHKKPPQQRSEFINLDRYQKAPPFQLRTANTAQSKHPQSKEPVRKRPHLVPPISQVSDTILLVR
ncbi:hypothetical protein SERLADRAFT_444047 [Serpula lacrymans var. lacrymans S7.9]|uniref:Uncharacterized protein n=1 Tax=Serpula lacrymans var. lacrymans (strain S7.9) TaxID=578457 RepID=F8PEA9_SERL9|nr:hypothetical protein SERLADRAFT_444047 [Serpula lacrymans var. lacrymans S7.9]